MNNIKTNLTSILVVARHEIRTLAREKTFILLLSIFFTMTFFSVFIGWATRTTTNNIYTASVLYLANTGVTHVPPNPLYGVSPLLTFDNMVIYILLIGALLAIVIGHRSFIRERKSGVLPLIFVRPTERIKYIFGKLLGIVVALLAITLATLLVSLVSTLFIRTLHLSFVETLRLFGFYAVSFLYLCLFAIVGFFFAIRTKNESTALFLPIMVWVAAVFIFPELITGQSPVSLLNPITLAQSSAGQGTFFTLSHFLLAPFSIGQFYTQSALGMLATNYSPQLLPAFVLLIYIVFFTMVSVSVVYKYESSQDILI